MPEPVRRITIDIWHGLIDGMGWLGEQVTGAGGVILLVGAVYGSLMTHWLVCGG